MNRAQPLQGAPSPSRNLSLTILRRRAAALGMTALVAALVSACASPGPLALKLMPAPEAILKGVLAGAATDQQRVDELPGGGVLYVTDRRPGQGAPGVFYDSVRGGVLRAGAAQVTVGRSDLTWTEMRREAHLRRKGDDLALKVGGIEEFGVLDSESLPPRPADSLSGPAARRLADAVNARLAASPEKDVFIFIHGFRVNFDNPVLVGAELWHFLGYQGALIAYSWPATTKVTAYVGDIETAMATARNLRELIGFIESSTDAERIHVVAHSAGTRLAVRAMEQIALINRHAPAGRPRLGRKVENVVLLSSDIDLDAFAASVADGLLGAQRHLVIYGSRKDSALRASKALTGHRRLGSAFGEDDLSDRMSRLFRSDRDRISYIDVTGVEGFDSGLGHSYFRSSPWVSSDLLMKLAYRLGPGERGLVRDEATGILAFPPDYIERMSAIHAARARSAGGGGARVRTPDGPQPAASGRPPAAR